MKKIRFFISSPGDVVAEREKVAEIFARLQVEFSGLLQLDPYFWEHEPMCAHADFQTQIEPPSGFDIFICLLFSRLGTALHPGLHRKRDGAGYMSGTEYELLDALEGFRRSGAPEVLIYKREGAPLIPAEPKEERERIAACYDALKAFFERFTREDGHYIVGTNSYAGLEDFEMKFEAGMRKLLQRRVPEGIAADRSVPKTWVHGSPFRGLHHFDFKHAPIFCGRTRAIDEVLSGLKQQAANGRPFVIIFGGSGVGKSSLMRAGVLPLLVKPGIVDQVRLWRRAVMRPSEAETDSLFEALAFALMRQEALPEIAESGITVSKLGDMLRDAPEGAAMLIQRELSHIGQDLRRRENLESTPRALFVLAMDQLEELFTIERLTPTREPFLRTLDALARSGHVWIVATLRSDFYHRCAESRVLGELIKKGSGQYCLLPPNETQLGQMIRLPAFAAGLQFEQDPNTGERLDDLLRDAAVRNPSTLPLLEFALEELYKQRDTETCKLRLSSYHRFGGVEGALGRRAEASFQSLSAEAQKAFGDLFLQLVTIGTTEAEPAVRQWARKIDIETSSARKELIARLIDDRLLFADCTEAGVEVVTIAHEAMLSSWPRLRNWVADHRDSLKVRAQVMADARRWRENDRNSDFLYKGLPLEKAKRAMDANFLLAEEREFVEAGLANEAEQRFRASMASGEQMQELSESLRQRYPDLWRKVLSYSLQSEAAPAMRRNAVALLGTTPEECFGTELVNVAVTDENPAVRREAALSLARRENDELYQAIESQAADTSTSAAGIRALAGIRIAADRWTKAPVFESRFRQLPPGRRRQISRKAWELRLHDGLPVLPFVAIPAGLFGSISAGIWKSIPGTFNWGLVQATPNPAMAAFHGLVSGLVWTTWIALGLVLYRVVFGRDLVKGSYIKPLGALIAGILFGFIGGFLVEFCVIGVYTIQSLETMGWILSTQPHRISLTREFFHDLFVGTRFGWPLPICGIGMGLGTAMMTNALQASRKFGEFLQRQVRLSSLSQAMRLIWNLIKLALPFVWPIPLMVAITAAAASLVPVRNYALPKATTAGIIQGLAGDCSTEAVGAFFSVVGMGLGIVILRRGLNVEGRKT